MSEKERLSIKIGEIEALAAQLISEMTAAFSRFLAKLAAGQDLTAEVDKLNTLATTIQSAIDQAKIEAQ